MAALMTFEMGSTDKVAEYRRACREMGVRIEPPSINASAFDFAVDRGLGVQSATAAGDPTSPTEARAAIRFGLGAIKGVGEKASTAIIRERSAQGPFRDLFDFVERVDLSAVNRATIEALICAGAFDATGAMRKALLDAVDRAIAVGETAQSDRRSGQLGLFGEGAPGSDDGPLSATLSNAEWSESEMLAREKAVLGFYITRHPLAQHEDLLNACATATTAGLARLGDGDEVTIGGMLSSVRTVTTRNGRSPGKQMGILTFEDLTGRVEAIVLPKDLVAFRPALVPDAMMFLQGTVDRRREEPALRVSRLIAVDDAPRELATALIVEIADAARVDPVVGLLREYPGPCRVYFNVRTEDGFIAQVETHAGIRVACAVPLLAGLADIVGSAAVSILGPNRRPIPVDPRAGAHLPLSG